MNNSAGLAGEAGKEMCSKSWAEFIVSCLHWTQLAAVTEFAKSLPTETFTSDDAIGRLLLTFG